MRKFLLASAAVFALSGAAVAADLPARGPAIAPAPAPVFVGMNWTGFYVGAQVGYAWGHDQTREFVTATGLPTGFVRSFSPDGVVGGLHAGVNYQMGTFVIGVEGDVEASGYSGSYRVAPLNVNGTNTSIDWQGSLRGRAGIAMDRALFYVTGGAAFANIKHRYVAGAVREGFSDTRLGWTLGAGLEYAFTNNLTARAEYRYTDFGSFRNRSTVAFPGFTYRQEPNNHTVRVGISYLFNSAPGPVVAKY